MERGEAGRREKARVSPNAQNRPAGAIDPLTRPPPGLERKEKPRRRSSCTRRVARRAPHLQGVPDQQKKPSPALC